jgi:hypothetical protein
LTIELALAGHRSRSVDCQSRMSALHAPLRLILAGNAEHLGRLTR